MGVAVMERGEMRANRWRRWVLMAAMSGVACCPRPLPCPTPPPADVREVTGDGVAPRSVSAVLGPAGGRLRLAEGAFPALFVPPGALTEAGRTFSLREVEPGRPGGAAGTSLGVPFEVSPPTTARLGQAFSFSVPLAALPAGCASDRVRFAVERPNDVGPADGRGSPTLLWVYEHAGYGVGTLSASIVQLHGQRMQFVCLPGGAP
jgi:hypothetical protein